MITRWIELALGLVQSVFMMILLFVAFNRVMHTVERKAGGSDVMPSFKVMVRRLWCRHRNVAVIRGVYGRRTTACVSCAKDVNRGKPREEWR